MSFYYLYELDMILYLIGYLLKFYVLPVKLITESESIFMHSIEYSEM